MRKVWFWLGVAALGAGLLVAAGCGGGKKETATTTPPTTTTTSGPVKGGVAKFNLASDTDYVDPALAYYTVSWQFEYATCAKLLNYPDKPAPQGSQLVPEVASSMPKVSADGKTYTFTIRPGFKFSPPSTETVTAKTFKFVIDRNLNPKMQSPAASFMGDIVGAKEMLDGKATSVSGVTAQGDKLTVKLTKVSPDFLARIAMPFFCAIPTTTPIESKGVHKLASAGPYYISSYTPNRRLVLTKNPNYAGDRPQNLDRMEYSVGIKPEQGLLQIKSGQADYAADGVPPSAHAELGRNYGPGSDRAKEGKQQYFVNPVLAFRYLALNTDRPLFKDAAMRRAVNFAIDRPAILRQRGAFAGKPTDQYLPPGVPGFKDADLYPLEQPDLTKAKELAGSKQETAIMYTCNESPCPEQAAVVQANLAKIGIKVEVKQFARAVQFSKEGTKGEPFDIAFEGWQADYADPFDFINILLDGTTIHDTNNVNFSYFNDPAYNKKMTDAAQLSGDKRFERYGQLDADIAGNAAPLAAWDNDNDREFFSERMGCQLHHPVYGMDLTALCIRKA